MILRSRKIQGMQDDRCFTSNNSTGQELTVDFSKELKESSVSGSASNHFMKSSNSVVLIESGQDLLSLTDSANSSKVNNNTNFVS